MKYTGQVIRCGGIVPLRFDGRCRRATVGLPEGPQPYYRGRITKLAFEFAREQT